MNNVNIPDFANTYTALQGSILTLAAHLYDDGEDVTLLTIIRPMQCTPTAWAGISNHSRGVFAGVLARRKQQYIAPAFGTHGDIVILSAEWNKQGDSITLAIDDEALTLGKQQGDAFCADLLALAR